MNHRFPRAQLEGLGRSQSWAWSPSLPVGRRMSDVRGHLEAPDTLVDVTPGGSGVYVYVTTSGVPVSVVRRCYLECPSL